MPNRFLWALLAAVGAIALTTASTALAHQTAVNNGVSVTMHVNPNDEPVAGTATDILVTRVKTRTGKFAWTTCRCTLVIGDSAGNILFKAVVKPRTEFTFPEAAAYSLVFSGRIKRLGKWKPFKVSFALRASESSN